MVYILGISASLLVAWLKKKFGTNEWATLSVLLAVSLIAAVGYVVLQNTSFWPLLVGILEAAGAFYAFVLQRFNSSNSQA